MTCSAMRREIPYRNVPHHVSLAIRKSSLSYIILYIVEKNLKYIVSLLVTLVQGISCLPVVIRVLLFVKNLCIL